jgi:TusE/DsrC/DsvC family sulfur relay protein
MMIDFLKLHGKRYELDDKGFLVKMSDWDVQLRDWFAEKEKIQLTEDHYEMIAYLREYFGKYRLHPVPRIIIEAMTERLGQEKASNEYFHLLFPGSFNQAYMIAGLPLRRSCC